MNHAESLLERLRSTLSERGEFSRGVLTLLSGTLLSRLLAVLAIPVLARLYTPGEFGELAVFTTLAGLVAAVAAGRYDMAVMLPEADEDALHLLLAAMLLASVVTACSVVVVWRYGPDIATALGAEQLAPWLWLNPPVIWALAAFGALRSWAARAGQFGLISASVVANTLLTVAVQLLAALAQLLSGGGLLAGRVAGQFSQSLVLFGGALRGLRKASRAGISSARLGAVMHRYRNFPLFDAGANLLNQASRELPVLLLGAFFGATVLGYYAVGRRILSIPAELIGNAVAQAYFPAATRELARGRLGPLSADVYTRLVCIAVTPMLMLAVIVPQAIAVFLGADWMDAVPYVRWLTGWVLVIFITAPFAQLFNVLEQQRHRLVYITLVMSAQAAALWWTGEAGDPVLAIAVFSVISAIGTLGNYVWLLHKAGVGLDVTLGVLLRQCLLALPFAGALWLATRLIVSDVGVLAVAALLGLIFAVLQFPKVIGRSPHGSR